jgi:hypothetical protein
MCKGKGGILLMMGGLESRRIYQALRLSRGMIGESQATSTSPVLKSNL